MFKNKTKLLILGLYLCCPFAFAEQANQDHKGNLSPYRGEPEKIILAEKERLRLEQGKTVLRKHITGKRKQAVIIFQVEAKPVTVWSVIKDFSHYPDWIEDITASEIYKQSDSEIFVHFDANNIFFGNTTWFARHNYPSDDRNWGTWTLDENQESDLDASVGFWRVTALETDPDQSIVVYSSSIKLRNKIPQFIVGIIVRARIRQATSWVKEQAELREAEY